jgi:two-component system NarL family response regulator
MMETNSIRVMVADDHPIVREGLRTVISLQSDMTIVSEASNGHEAIALFRSTRPDVAVIDLRMPQCSGLEATISIRGEFPGSRIVILTTYAGDEDVYRALNAGARAYLLKGCDVQQLLAAIRTVHAGGRHIPPDVSSLLADHLGSSDLTLREREVLRMVARGKKNRAIATTLGVTEGTIKGHLNNILSKLGVRDRTQATITALLRGIVHLEDES